MQDFSLGIHDFGMISAVDPRTKEPSARLALDRIVELAELAERAGYARFWLAEHHVPEAAESTPELVLPVIGSRTRRIRIGTGCTLLPYYSPMKVAKNFQVLEALFPGRVDLGLGRGPGAESATIDALTDFDKTSTKDASFQQKAADLLTLLRPEPPSPSASLLSGLAPQVWIAARGPGTLALAASLGIHCSWAHFLTSRASHHDPWAEAELIHAHYTSQFQAGPWGERPRHNLAVTVLCGRSSAEAERLNREVLRTGGYGNAIVGSPEECVEQLGELATRYGTSEFAVACICRDFAKKSTSYELLASACRLRPVAMAPDAK